ncbi:MAG: TIGR02281 family clan AA aspartic protease [Caulobacteraceae bacterium]|jgi:aspartyl protease family protein
MSDSHGPWGPERPTEPPRRPPPRPPLRGAVLWLGLLAFTIGLVMALSLLLPGQTPGEQDVFQLVRLVGLAALVSSGLMAARRIHMVQAARYALTWGAILILLALLYQDRAGVLDLGRRLATAFAPAEPMVSRPVVTASNSTQTSPSPIEVQIGRSEGGGFYAMGQVNGEPVRFLIDTGSSEIVLSPQDAARVHLVANGEAKSAETANGVATGQEATADSVGVGPLRLTSVPVYVNSAPMNVSLLGLSFLDRLDSYEVHGDQIILRGKQAP